MDTTTPGSRTIRTEAVREFRALGTTVRVVTTGPPEPAVAAVRAELAAVDVACSRFRDDSELAALNAAGGRPTVVGPVLLDAVRVALRAARITDGLVDPTVGNALVRLGYDRDFGELAAGEAAAGSRPAARRPRLVRRHDWRSVEVDAQRSTVRIPARVLLDLGATAKPRAVDRAAAAAAAAVTAGTAVLVGVGGDIAFGGTPPPGGWSVRVTDDHAAGPDAPGQTIAVTDGGVATSSTTVRRWRSRDADVHHLIDPRTRRPAIEAWRTATVVAGNCVDANIASTAAIVLGPAAAGWLSAAGLPARLVTPSGQVLYVGDWPVPAVDRPVPAGAR